MPPIRSDWSGTFPLPVGGFLYAFSGMGFIGIAIVSAALAGTGGSDADFEGMFGLVGIGYAGYGLYLLAKTPRRVTVDGSGITGHWLLKDAHWPAGAATTIEFREMKRFARTTRYVATIIFDDGRSLMALDSFDYSGAMGRATELAAALNTRLANRAEAPMVVTYSASQFETRLKDAVEDEEALDQFVAGLGFRVMSHHRHGKIIWYVHDVARNRDVAGEYDDRKDALVAAGKAAEDAINKS